MFKEREIKMKISAGNNTTRESALLKLQDKIRQKTDRRVRDIKVNLEGTNGDSALILLGKTNAFYIKQLAQHAVKDLPEDVLKELDLSHQPKITNQIEVT